MLEQEINLWNFDGYKCITTNGVIKANGCLVMGAGLALYAKRKFPSIDLVLGDYVKAKGNRCAIIPEWKIISFPTKNEWKEKSDIELIKKSCKEVMFIADKYKIDKIGISKVGCGNGQLIWTEVKSVIEKLLDDRVTVCYY